MAHVSNNSAVSFHRPMDAVQNNATVAAGDISNVKPTNSLKSILEGNKRTADKSLNSWEVTKAEPLSIELILALSANDKKQIKSIMLSKDFNISNEEAIIKIMAILVETNNIKMLQSLNIRQKKAREQHPKFYCI